MKEEKGEESKNVQKIKVSIDTGTFIRAIAVVAVAALILLVREVVLIVLVGAVIAVAIDPAIRFFEEVKIGRFTMPRAGSVAIVYSLGFLMLALFFYFVVPIVAAEVSGFLRAVRDISVLPETETLTELSGQGQATLSEFAADVRQTVRDFLENILSLLSTLFGGALSAILVLVISFYIAVQKNIIDRFLALVIPARYSDYAQDLWGRSQKKIGQWIQGQLISALIVGSLVYLGLLVLGVPYALLFALLAMVMELIPIIGPVLASIPALAVAFIEGGVTQGLLVGAFYLVVQQLEGNIIYPLIMKRMVGIPSLIAIIAIAVGATLAGFLGVLLAVPVAAVVLEFLSDLRKRERGEAPQPLEHEPDAQ